MIPLGVLAQRQAATGGGLAADYIASYSTSAASITVDVGSAHAGRVIVVASSMVNSTAGRYVSGISLNGSPATEDARIQEAGSSGGSVTIYRLALPSGTTATLGITYSGTAATVHHSIYAISAPVAVTASGTQSGGSPMSVTLTGASPGDILIGVANQPVSTPALTFTTGVTDDYSPGFHAMGHGVAAAADTTVSATPYAAAGRNMLAAVAYEGA